MKRYFNNPEIKKSSAVLIFIMFIFLLYNYVAVKSYNERLKEDYIEIFSKVTAKIVEKDLSLKKK